MDYCIESSTKKPLRDAWGRLVYPNDQVRITTDTRELVVDLILSPDTTNYDRYFADLGDIYQIIQATLQSCIGDCTTGCPFVDWAGRDTVECSCEEFILWLDHPAID